ncbi:putative cytochrome b5 [Colletotrichum shisoi]|uniref:Putative cytochrome b5 n=1 Tax=Colletotrichum shisoi TaxID=2078593 RepID=A0A5Q4BX80_9PEZI|nr:putative cytochrome b5 [Colletotrichum shisoi]
MPPKQKLAYWWLEPTFPSLDSEGTDFCDYTPVPKPPTPYLDALFISEHVQLRSLGGLRTSESIILQQLDPYTPRVMLPKVFAGFDSGDSSEEEEQAANDLFINDDDDYSIDVEPGGVPLFHSKELSHSMPAPWVERDFVQVDESKWFKLFRRERWANYCHSDPSQISVDIDNDDHWRRLSRVIEIANRILNAVADQEWIGSFVDPRARDTRAPVTSGKGTATQSNTAIYRVVPSPPASRFSKAQARAALDDIAKYFFWGFHMPDEYPNVTGKTCHVLADDGVHAHWMTLALDCLTPVFKDSTPGDPEGRQAAVGMAKTMLHELSFFKEERWAEAGYSFENSVFGTTVKNHWLGDDGRIQYLGIRGLTPHTCESDLHYTYDNWSNGDPFIDMPLGIPAVFPCAMTTSDFWESHVQRYGASSLRTSWVCEGRTELSKGTMQVWPAKVMSEPYKYSRYVELNKSMKSVAQMLRKRRLDLKRLRPWYAEEYAFWCQTVYAHSRRRFAMGGIALGFRGRSVKHEAEAREGISTLIKPYQLLSNLEKVGPDRLASQMFFQAFGFLALAALPIRTSPLRYQDESIGEYPDRISQGLRPGFAGDGDLVGWLLKCGERILATKKSNTLHGTRSPSHDKELCMSNASLAFRRWEVLGCVTGSIVCDFETEWQIMRRRLDQAPFDDIFLDWDSASWRALAPYQGPAAHTSPTSLRPDNKRANKSKGVDADIPAWAIARPMMTASTAPAPARDKPNGNRVPYYTVGEVGDHQIIGASGVWGCLFDGKEMGIYDITDLILDQDGDVLEWNHATIATFTQPSPIVGAPRVIDPQVFSPEWSNLFRSRNRFIGNVMIDRVREDVMINDGKLGRPRWAALANSVFDITEIGFDHDLRDLEDIFTCTVDEDPVLEAINRGYHPDVLQKALSPYKIGSLWDKSGTRRFRDRAFTANDVKWHTTRETGIYAIIGRFVYDFTELIDKHPGGSEIIAQVAGGDATELWEKYHGNPISKLGVNVDRSRQFLCIGHVVEERDTKAVSPDEICIRDYIFSNNSVEAGKPILESLTSYWGTDGTAELEKQNPNKAYLDLWERTNYIVAKVVKPLNRLPYMSREVLREMDGRKRPEGFNELFVSDGMYVYNVTSLVRYNKLDPWLEVLKLKAGSVLAADVPEEYKVKEWLWNTNRHRIIGLYRSPKHSSSTAEIPVAWKTSPRRTPSMVPKLISGSDPSEDATKKTWAQVALQPPMGVPAPPTTPFTVRPLYPPRKKQKRRKECAPGSPNPVPSLSRPFGSVPGSPMDVSQSIAMTALEEMGFAMRPGTETGVRKRKMGNR